MRWLVCLGILGWLAATPVRALILYGDVLNDTAPPAGTPFGTTPLPFTDVIGVLNSSETRAEASGVYLGDGWVLTTNHVVLHQEITYDGASYAIMSGTATQIGTADLKVFRVEGLNATSNIVLYDVPVPALDASAESAYVGWGVGKGTERLEEGELVGWNWGGASTVDQRWGTNTTLSFGANASGTIALITEFDSTEGDNEFSLTLGDSGGGLFTFIAGQWYLTGIGIGVEPGTSNFSDFQPPTRSYFARIAEYSDEIQEATAPVPEPAAGTLAVVALAGWAWRRRSRRA